MNEKAEELKRRTKRFALDVLQLVRHLPAGREGDILGRQLLKSATSVAANYRAACRARSKAEFASKIGIALEEADESTFWLEILEEGKLVRNGTAKLRRESDELVSILAASRRTARANISLERSRSI